MAFIHFGRERKGIDMINKEDVKNEINNQILMEEKNKIENWNKMQQLQSILFENSRLIMEERFEREQKRREFEAIVKADEEKKELAEKALKMQDDKYEALRKNKENKEKLQKQLVECSKSLRDIQQSVKDTYMFTPCKQMCELLINIRNNVYHSISDIQEDFEDVLYAFGINEFKPSIGEMFDAKYHNQVYSNVPDARGKCITRVYSSGFEMDGEIIVKACVSVEEIIGGNYE